VIVAVHVSCAGSAMSVAKSITPSLWWLMAHEAEGVHPRA
jgi:hypothetical protein